MLNNSQFIKLFDRRFVANTLRNSYRCPKCRNEYSYNYDMADKFTKDSHIKSNRPMLLPCGHNMCENCVYHNRQNLTCVTCLQPIEIENDQFTNFVVRDHFDMNFYLLGELNHLRYSRKDGSANNTLIMSGTQQMDITGATASSVIKCIECELVPAMGKCRQCKVYLCKRCFDAVHQNSKVLKMHIMQRFDKDITKTDMTRLMKPRFCKRHSRICDRYCVKCDFVCCLECTRKHHQYHDCTTLMEENMKLSEEISVTLENAQSSRKTLEKGLKDIKSVEIQLEEYATKTFEDISNYFLQIHSFLQNEEKRITLKFSEMCQQPQFKLREAHTKLKESHEIINTMRANLEYYQRKPVSEFHLGTILSMYNQQLEQMPSQIQITKPLSNPFKFEIISDILKDIDKYYISDYNDPKISLKIETSFYDSNPSQLETTTSMMSMLDITQNTNLPHQQQQLSKSKNNKKNQKKKKKAENKNYSFITDDTVLQPTNSQKSSSSATANKPYPSSHDENLVRVTHIKSPEHFYIHNVNDINKIRELSHTYLNCTLANRIPKVISEGYYYMAYHTTDKQWYRGMLKEMLQNDVYKMFLVDFGIHLEVTKDKLCEIQQNHLKIPFAAIRCAISNIMPPGKQWTEVANNFLIELLQNKPARMSIIEKMNDILKIDLHTAQTKSVRDSFLYAGLARERPGALSFKMQIKSITPNVKIEERIPKNNVSVTGIMNVHMLNIEGPQEFYVIKVESIEKKQEFERDLNVYYAAKSDKVQQIYLATLQMGCVICLKDKWYRAVVEEIKDKGQLMVRLVDEGRREVINWRQAYVLDDEFRKKREFAICCALADIEPLQENGYIYTVSAINDFKQMTINPSLRMEVVAAKQNTYKVILYVCKKNLDINIGASLVKNKHGISTGESTQITEFIKTPKKRLSVPQILSNELITAAPNPLSNVEKLSTKERNIYKNKESLNPNQCSSSKKQAIKTLKRTLIKITHVVNPGEFYIHLYKLSYGTKAFHQQIQDAQGKKYDIEQQPPQENREWFLNNHCLVYTKYHSSITINKDEVVPIEQCCEWYRGIITDIIYQPGEEPKFSVFLRDIGATVCSIASQQLFSIDAQLNRVTNAVYSCHLACIEPTGGQTWSQSAMDAFRTLIGKFETLSVSLQGKRSPDRMSLPIVLWGSKTETADPLAPCITKYKNINRALVDFGLAHMIERLDVTQQFDKIEEMELAEGEITLEQWFKAFSDNSILKAIERNDQLPSILSGNNCDFAVDDNNENALDHNFSIDHPLSDYLHEFDFEYTTDKKAPAAWCTSKVINKTIFSGFPTYIDFDCILYLHDAVDKEFLSKLSNDITKTYGHFPPQPLSYAYKVGQACIAKYHLDKMYYRGIVVADINDKNEWGIQFIDYGNIETLQTNDVRPYAPYPNLPAIANKFIIEGIKPKGGEKQYHIDDLDQMHKLLVTKFVSIRIPSSELNKKIRLCNLRLGQADVASMFIANGLADADLSLPAPAKHPEHLSGSHKQRRNLNPLPSEPDLDYDIFNEEINMSIDQHNEIDDDDTYDDDTSDTDYDDDKFDHLNEMIQRLDKDTKKEQTFPLHMFKNIDDDGAAAAAMSTNNTTAGLNSQQQPPKKRMFKDTDYTQMMKVVESEQISENFDDDDDDDGLDDENFFQIYEEEDDVVELEARYALNYWHDIAEDMLKEEQKEINQQLDKRASYHQEEQDMESEFDGFHPNETSTVFSHYSGMESFKLPQLPAVMHHFICHVNCIITSTILQIFPNHAEFRYREVELQRSIKQLVKSAPPLAQFDPRTICLALYSKDKIWYRALIRSYNPTAKTVDVLYVDYLNSETLPIKNIRQCPTDLLGWPLRTFRVRLHGLKPNPQLKEHDIRLGLYKLLAKRKLFAVIKKHPNHRSSASNSVENINLLSNSDLMEIALYESQEISLKGITVYEPLIEKNYFQRI